MPRSWVVGTAVAVVLLVGAALVASTRIGPDRRPAAPVATGTCLAEA